MMIPLRRLALGLNLLLLTCGSALAQMPAIGKPAPAFSLSDQTGTPVAFPPKGNWAVLAFYPRAATPG